MAEKPVKRPVTLTANEVVAPAIHVLTFRVAAGGPFTFEPGQYITFYLTRGGASLTRSYSFYSEAGTVEAFELLVKRVEGGYGSTLLCGLTPDSPTALTGLAPLGKFTLRDPGDRSVVFVATGTGLAPFRPMIDALRARNPSTPTALIFGNRHLEDVVRLAEFRALETDWPAFRFLPVLSRPPADGSWTGAAGHVQDAMRDRFPDLAGADVYICGVPEMVNEAQELAIRLGCPKERVFVERY